MNFRTCISNVALWLMKARKPADTLQGTEIGAHGLEQDICRWTHGMIVTSLKLPMT